VTCDETSILLPQLLAGSLDRQTEAETLVHLAGCPRCREELAFWAEAAAAAAELAPEMPASLHRQMGADLRREIRESSLGDTLDILRDAALLTRKTLKLTLACAGRSLPEGA